MAYAYPVKILERHLDTFGHVNNATYLELLEEARWELTTSRGFGMADVQKKQQGPVILEVNIKFLKELRLRQMVNITIEMLGYKSRVGVLRQQVLDAATGEVMADANVTFGFFDMKARKLIEPTPEWLDVLKPGE